MDVDVDDDTDLREQIFNNTVREKVVSIPYKFSEIDTFKGVCQPKVCLTDLGQN